MALTTPMSSRQPLGLSPSLGSSSRKSGRRPDLPTGQLIVGGVVLGILVLLFVIGSIGGSDPVDAEPQDRTDLVAVVQPALTRAGYGDVIVESDGRTVTISGELPTRTDVVAADAVVKSIAEVAFVVNNLSHPGDDADIPLADEGPGVVSSGAAITGVSNASLQLQSRIAGAAALDPISFQTGSVELTPESATTIANIAQILLDNPTARIEVGGHTDSDGLPEENELLSQSRAEAVVTALVAQGVESERLDAVGFGDTQPIASNETGEGKARNRRIEFLLLL